MATTTNRPTPAQSIAEDSVIYGAIHLDVSDADRSIAFWSGLIGLQVLSRTDQQVHLGVEDRELLVLHPGAAGPTPRGHSGLYHLAIHLPSEAEFARVLLRIAQAGYPQAPTDHIMHWATYLDDPDGIGLELSFETLDRFSHYTFANGHPMVVDSAGELRRATDHLDVEEVISHLPDRNLSQPLPVQTRIGHIHLHVGEIAPSLAFYAEVLELTPNIQEPLFGMADMQAGGSFPHRIAINVWQGKNAPQRPPGTAGLRHFEMRLRSAAELDRAVARAQAASAAAADDHVDGFLVHDPAGNKVTLATE